MKAICKTISIFLIVFGINTVSAFATPLKYSLNKELSDIKLSDITVGHRSDDSTGQLSISNSAIQQSIIPVITMLNTTIVTAGNASLFVFQNMAYLQFGVRDTAGVLSLIAIQLDESSTGDFIFHAEVGNELHILTNSENCASCMYTKEMGALAVTSCNTDSPCRHRIYFSLSTL